MNIAIVIPAYNEEKRIAATLKSIQGQGYRCIVVDDGSGDETSAAAASYAIVLRHPVNRGMGAALVTGTAYALSQGADIIVHFDADGQHHVEDIPNVVKPIIEGTVDVVFGSRYLGTSNVPWTKRYFIHYPARWLQNRLTGLTLTDVHNGFRALNSSAASRIRITQDRMAHASEIVSEVKRLGLRFCEVPVTITYRSYGQGLLGGMRIIKDLIIRKLLS